MDNFYDSNWVGLRTKELFQKSQQDLHQHADYLFKLLMFLQLGLLICVAFIVTPATWIGQDSDWQFHVVATVLLGSLISAIPFFLTRTLQATATTRHTFAICQMVWSMLFIHLSGGRIETHFHIFGSLALLTFYRDWKVLLTATLVITIDQFTRGFWWPMSVFGVPEANLFRCLEHTGWILIADLVLVSACFQGNDLSSQLCHRQAELEQANRDVEQLVWSRTKDLKSANRTLKGAIKTRLKAETDREKLTRKLLQASRQAGMSEVATGVLHSVGNVINSINVSTETVLDQLADSRIDRLDKVAEMINKNSTELTNYLTQGEKGKHIPEYVWKATQEIKKQHHEMYAEIVSMRDNVAHIAEIVFQQQALAQVGGVSEEFCINSLCDDALNINRMDRDRDKIEIIREFGELPMICTERHKVMRIVVDLVSNAKHALLHSKVEKKQIRITTTSTNSRHLSVRVEDNGMGISAANLDRIFQHGFTTRRDGHGFGLHSSVLAAHELNGSLEASSPGEGKGAAFELTLPVAEVPVNSINATKFVNPSYNMPEIEGSVS